MYTSRKFFYRVARESSVKGVEMNRIVCSPIVLMISRSSMSYRGESSCDPSSSDVVSPDMVYELLSSLVLYISVKVADLFSLCTRWTRGKKGKEPRFNESARRSSIFLDRVEINRSHIPHFSILWLLWFEFFFLHEREQSPRAESRAKREFNFHARQMCESGEQESR